MTQLINFLYASIKAGTPLLFGTSGEILTQKSGNMNLGVEGMMYLGAIASFYVGFNTNNFPLAILAAAAAGAFGALIFAFITVTLKANQTVTGLALTIFGTGVANFFGEVLANRVPNGSPKLPEGFMTNLAAKNLFGLADAPVVGRLLFNHNILVYLGVVIAIIMGIYLRYTRFGLNVRSVGENPAAADAAGINVTLIKYVNTVIGGSVCGLGGAYIALVNGGGVWNNGCVNGQGWIAVALVIFASWSPFKALLGSLVFGASTVLQFYVPRDVIELPNAFYMMLPFLITSAVLVITSMKKKKEGAQPASCGANYFREER